MIKPSIKISTWLAKNSIWNIALKIVIAIFSISTATGIIWGIFSLIDTSKHSDISNSDNIKTLTESFKIVTDSVSQLTKEIREISPQMTKINRSVNSLTNSNINLKDYMLQNAATKDDVMKILQIWEDEKKK